MKHVVSRRPWRIQSIGALLLALGATVACARSGYGILVRDEGDSAPTTWGDFAATLDVPECPASNEVLIVNTTADELDGGESITDPSAAGDMLSFRESIWIAANRGTPHNIFFDTHVFPATAPGVIHVRGSYEMPTSAPGLCIDGRRRGVIVEYADEAISACGGHSPNPCEIPLTDGALLVGLSFRGAFLAPAASTIAGCVIDSVAPSGSYTAILYAWDASLIGPGNVFRPPLDTNFPTVLLRGGELRDSYFSFDPLLHVAMQRRSTHGFLYDVDADTTFENVQIVGNLFCEPANYTIKKSSSSGTLEVAGNFFGVDRDGLVVPGCTAGFVADAVWASSFRFGPSNVMRGIPGSAVVVFPRSSATVTITRNVITGNGSGIVYPLGNPVVPPSIGDATRTSVTGTCAVAGTIEVFSDPGDQGEQFLGDVACDGVSPWTLSVTVPSGRNVTATLADTNGATSPFSAPAAVP